VTLDDVSCLLHLVIEGMLLAREGSMPKTKAKDMMVHLLGADVVKAWKQVERTNGGHARFSWLKDIFKEHFRQAQEAHQAGHIVEIL